MRGLMRADRHAMSTSTVERAMRRRELLPPVDYTGERGEHAKARKAAFADPPTGPNQVWQLDFCEYETTAGGIWRLAGCCDYYSKYEYGWHIGLTFPILAASETTVRLDLAHAASPQLQAAFPGRPPRRPMPAPAPPAGRRGRVRRNLLR
jgi:putative transposase